AYLTRPEGALLVVAAGLVLLAMQFYPPWRASWRRATVCSIALVLAALAVGSPYVLITGRLTNKPTPRRLWESAPAETVLEPASMPSTKKVSGPFSGLPSRPIGDQRDSQKRVLTPFWLMAATWAVYAPENLKDRHSWGLYAIATEVTKDFQYLSMLPLVVGLGWFRAGLKSTPGVWVMVALCALHFLILWRLAIVVG